MTSSKIADRFMNIGLCKTGDRIFACTAIALAGSFYFFEHHYPFMDVMRMIITVLIVLLWTANGLLAGKQKQWGFLAYAFLYWNIPYLYILIYNSTGTVESHSSWSSMLYTASDMIMLKPFEAVSAQLKIDSATISSTVAILAMAMFAIGILIINIYNKSVHQKPEIIDNDVDDTDNEEDSERNTIFEDADFDSYEEDEDDIYFE